MISTRNATRTLVIGKFAVPVRDITNLVCDHKTVNWITRRLPVSVTEIFESIDAVHDLDKFPKSGNLKISNNATALDEIDITIMSVSDVAFLKLIAYGRLFLPREEDFHRLFDVGLLMSAYEAYKDVISNLRDYEASELHCIVFDAFQQALPEYTVLDVFNNLSEELKNEGLELNETTL